MGHIQAIEADLVALQSRQVRRDEARAKLDAEEACDIAEAADLRIALAVLKRYEPTSDDARAAQVQQPLAPPPAWTSGSLSPKRRVKSDSDEVVSLLEIVKGLVTAQAGLKTNELYRRVLAAGGIVPGDSPQKNFSTILTRNKAAYGLDSTRSGGWFLIPTVNATDALARGALLGHQIAA